MARDQARGARAVSPRGQAPRRSRRARGALRQRAQLRCGWPIQPIVSWTRSKSVFAYEALVRNEEPTLRAPPDLFEAAERLGRLHELGRIDPRPRRRDTGRQPDRRRPGVRQRARRSSSTTTRCWRRRRRCRRIATRVVLEITERAPLDEDPGRRRRASRSLRAHGLSHRRRRSRRRLRGAHQLRAARARGGQGRHVAHSRDRPLADQAEAAAVDRRRCAATSGSR